ncbi:MAG: hypothetical protein ACE5LU_13560 [Anaerolineae bacterium]
MTDASLYSTWSLSLIIAAVVVVIAAVLLLLVIQAARRIERLAAQALQVAGEIEANTNAVWNLQETNHVAAQLRESAQTIEVHAAGVAEVLHET